MSQENAVIQRVAFPIVYKENTIGYWNLDKELPRYEEIESRFLEILENLEARKFTSKAGQEFLTLNAGQTVIAWYQEVEEYSYTQVLGFLSRGTAKVESFSLGNKEQDIQDLLDNL